MTMQPPTLEQPLEGSAPPLPEVLFREARRRRRRRWAVATAIIGLVGAAAALGYGGAGNTTTPRPSAEGHAAGRAATIRTTWHSDETTVFKHGWPPSGNLFPTRQPFVTCAGYDATACYLSVLRYGILPNGQRSTAGSPTGPTLFVSSEFRSIDDGRTWAPLVLPDRVWTSTAFSCPSASTCAVGALTPGGFTQGSPVLVTTTDGGRRWAVRQLPKSAGLIQHLSCPTTTDCVAVTLRARTITRIDGMEASSLAVQVLPNAVFATHDSGKRWSRLTLPPMPRRAAYELSVTCPAATRCIFMGRRVRVAPRRGSPSSHLYEPVSATTVVLTVGRHRHVALSLHASGLVSCLSAAHCIELVDTTHRDVYTTSDGARSWRKAAVHGVPRSTPTTPGVWTLQCVSATSCLAIGKAKSTDPTTVLTTTDGGEHWKWGAALTEVSCAPSGICVGVQADPALGETRIVTNAP